jgi:hypothetical protein
MDLFSGWGRTALVGIALAVLDGCATAPLPPTYTQEELQAQCERHRGWWHPDGLIGGFCEYDGRM